MINSRKILPLFESYVRTYKNKNFSISQCSETEVIKHLDQGYVYCKQIYNPPIQNCSCFIDVQGQSNKILYIYIFEFAYSLLDGKASYGDFDFGSESTDQIFVENYVKNLMISDGNGDF